MRNELFFHKMAVERCQYYVAQLCAAAFVDPLPGEEGEPYRQTIQALIENLNRDLGIIGSLFESCEDDDRESQANL